MPYVHGMAWKLGAALLLIAAGALPTRAADNGPDYVAGDLKKACNAAGGVCRATCRGQYPNRKASVSQSISHEFCVDDCNKDHAACIGSIPASTQAGGQTNVGGGAVLDPGPRRPQKRSPVGAPASAGAAQ